VYFPFIEGDPVKLKSTNTGPANFSRALNVFAPLGGPSRLQGRIGSGEEGAVLPGQVGRSVVNVVKKRGLELSPME